MPTVKLPKANRDHRTSYYCVRLWKRDLLDVVTTLADVGCQVYLEDKTHNYNDVDDFLEHAPVNIRNLVVTGETSDHSGYSNVGIYFYVNADSYSIVTNYSGDPIRCSTLNDHIGFLFTRRRKPLGLFLRKGLGKVVLLIPIWTLSTLLFTAFLHFSNSKSNTKLIKIFVCGAIVVLVLSYFQYIEKVFVRCDLWFKKNEGEDTFWKRNRDKIALELLKIIAAATVGGFITHYVFSHS